ncbi:MAG TPA: DUF1254 domain-containing protein [Gaiellaceae bacterium]|nr:DUF1254 domain-containing protein [Gaiellaceae bacterium]
MEFFDGVPKADTVSKMYDALDLVRGIDVFLNCVPGASLVAMRRGVREVGLTSPAKIAFTDPRANSRALFLTANTETTYGTTFLDLKAWGPTVVEAPPGSLCVVDDFWFRYVADMGIAGPDRGEGGNYLFLPPGFQGEEPDGYFTFRSPTYTNWVILRALGGIDDLRKTRIYPLSEAAAPKENEWVNWGESAFNTVHANDFGFFEEINELVQEEPTEALDPERAGQLAALGIVKGKPFAPDERLRRILDEAARVAAGMARTLTYAGRDPAATIMGSWKQGFIGGSYEFVRDGARLLDARAQFHYFATVITPAMAHAQVGAGSAYAYTVHDANGNVLDGARNYRLHVEPDPPAKNFWSIDVYDTQTRSLLQVPSTIWPSITSTNGDISENDDGSYDLYFGPAPPDGKESNWVETLPGKAWFTILRLYGPLQPWFDQTWKLNEFEPIS